MPARKYVRPADTSIAAYVAKRDFSATPEPAPGAAKAGSSSFVVQKHHAARARLHWDFRLEHDGVMWSWAVPKGPSLDPSHKRMAIHVEDHPLDYASFEGEIAAGNYGAGTVEQWDRGTWTPLFDPDAGMQKGHLHFTLQGTRLRGDFSLVRLPRRGNSKQEAWLLIKGPDDGAREGVDALALEATPLAPAPANGPPLAGAVEAELPVSQKPQLCTSTDAPPERGEWLSEIKFDGYRLIVRVERGDVRLLTRNGLDWTAKMPRLVKAFAGLGLGRAMLDGELVIAGADGRTDFGALQAALSDGRDRDLTFYAFDLLYLDGWDLRGCALIERKRLLQGLAPWTGMLRFSDHQVGHAAEMLAQAGAMGLEGIVMKRVDAPYRAGRGSGWVKIKVLGRAEFVVLGWTPPAKSRVGLGALQVGYYDDDGRLHFAGGVGTGFSDQVLGALRERLDGLAGARPDGLVVEGEKPARAVRWVRPELVAEISFTDWSSDGRLRHAVFLGLREDKAAREVVRDKAVPVEEEPVKKPEPAKGRIVMARAPKAATTEIDGVHISHATRELWPGITKADLAHYWQQVAEHAMPGIVRRPLAVLRCPEGVDGEQFFQKNRHGYMPDAIRDGMAMHQPYLAVDDIAGVIGLVQMSAIEIHPWGATEDDVAHPDRLVFDLDPGEGVAWAEIVQAALDMRARLERIGLASFCRTSGGKGLHVVVPLAQTDDWPSAKAFCRALAETISDEEPKRFLAHTKIADRKGRILIDWLRNGPGATAVASFCPRARPGATVATPLDWKEVNGTLDAAAFTVLTVPGRLAKLKADPWAAFAGTQQSLPQFQRERPKVAVSERAAGASRIVVAHRPSRRG